MNDKISINKTVKPLVEKLLDTADQLNVGVHTTDGGAKIIDAGINYNGCLESGNVLTILCWIKPQIRRLPTRLSLKGVGIHKNLLCQRFVSPFPASKHPTH